MVALQSCWEHVSEPLDWLKVLLKDHVDLLTGFPFKSEDYTTDTNDVRLLRGDNVAQGWIRWDGVKRWPKKHVDHFNQYLLQTNDVILAMDRPWIETGLKWAWVKESDLPCLLVQRVARMRGKNGLLTGYLRYIVGDQSFSDYIRPIVTGVNVPHISSSQILAFSFCLPPLIIQRKVVAILSAYDNLIENNVKRIKILEQMAEAIYREWFVHFRFPGYEKVKMVDSPLGKIPEGWETAKFTDLADILSGGTPKTQTPEYWNGEIPFFTPRDVPGSFYVIETKKSITKLGLSKCNSQLYPKETVFITARGTVGNVVMPAVNMAMNQSCYALIGRQGVSQLYLFLRTQDSVQYLKKNTGGATFDTIVIDTFRRFDVVKPPLQLIEECLTRIRPIFQMMQNLLFRNINLRSTRDLLLPKLISHKVNVSELDIDEGNAVL
jgi:type I restriction enzyme S subunit